MQDFAPITEKKILKHDKRLTECESEHCEPCQCHKQFKVVCSGHCFQAGHISKFELQRKVFDLQKKEERKKSKMKSKYSVKFLRSLISQRTWVIAPESKLTCQTIDLRKTKLTKAPENLRCVDSFLEALRFDESQSLDDVTFFKQMKNLRIVVMKHCNLQSFSDTRIDDSGLLALDIYGNQYIDSFTDLKLFSRLQHLNIGRCNLNRIPEEVFWLKKLRVLVLEDNYLHQPIADLSSLKRLQVLILRNCGLTEFPQGVSEMEELLYLSIESNKIAIVPTVIVHMQKLAVLSVYGNRKIQLPNKLSRCPALKRINVNCDFSCKSLSSKMIKLVKVWKDTPSAWWKQL